jgi:hypothetical protein
VQARRVGEGELAEVVLGDKAVLYQLPRLLQHLGHVRHVEVPDVGGEDGVEAVIAVPVEGPGGHGVVGLAAEVECSVN